MKLEEELKQIEEDILTRKQIEEFEELEWKDFKYKEFFKNPELTEDFKLYVVNQNGYIIQYIPNPSEEIQLAAVSQDGYSIRLIKNPSEKIQLAAIRENRWAVQFIKNPTEKAKKLARSKGFNL